MNSNAKRTRIFRWALSLLLVVAGLSATWAWGQVARLAGPEPQEQPVEAAAQYAAWQPAGSDRATLFRSLDRGETWEPLALPEDALPVAWAGDGAERLAVALDNGILLRSDDRGDGWDVAVESLSALSLVWGDDGSLYLGTDGQGIHRLAPEGDLTALTAAQGELATAAVRHLAMVNGRLFAATPTVLFHTDDGGRTWNKSLPVPGRISALAVTDADTVFVGTETVGVYRSADAGQTWQPALDGLGLAAGQMVRVTALHADPQQPGVLYAAVDHVLGSTQVHASAAGAFVTLDGGALWQPMAGPTFPDAQHASDLILVAERPLYVQTVTDVGLERYGPDVASAMAMLQSDDAQSRADAARVLGLGRVQEAGQALLAALADPEPVVSMAAASALGRIDDPAMASGLLVALDHPREQVRLGAMRALGMMGVEGAVEPLQAVLFHGDGAAVNTAAEALGFIGTPAAAEALMTTLADPEMTPRQHAAMAALEGMGERAVEPLVNMLGSEDVYARRNAAEALGWVGSPAATEALVQRLEDRSASVRQQAAWALGEIGGPAARAALERAQERDEVTAVRVEADLALARVGEQPVSTARWPASWAPALSRFQALRWLILTLSLAGAAWLAAGNTRLSPALVLRRSARQ